MSYYPGGGRAWLLEQLSWGPPGEWQTPPVSTNTLREAARDIRSRVQTVAVLTMLDDLVRDADGGFDTARPLTRELLTEPLTLAAPDAGLERYASWAKDLPAGISGRGGKNPEVSRRVRAIGYEDLHVLVVEVALTAGPVAEMYSERLTGPLLQEARRRRGERVRVGVGGELTERQEKLVGAAVGVLDGMAEGSADHGYAAGAIVVDRAADVSRAWLAAGGYTQVETRRRAAGGPEPVWQAEVGRTGVLELTDRESGRVVVFDGFRRRFFTGVPVPDATAEWVYPAERDAAGEHPAVRVAEELLAETAGRLAVYDGGVVEILRRAASQAAQPQ